MALIENKKARHDYEILETLEAGLVLLGFEVKALRSRQGSLAGARVIARGGEAYVIDMTIPPYQPGNTPPQYDPARNRKLLLSKSQIAQIADMESRKGLTVVPISVYNKGKTIKMGLGIVRGRKKFDKREVLKRRTTEREIRRTLKNE